MPARRKRPSKRSSRSGFSYAKLSKYLNRRDLTEQRKSQWPNGWGRMSYPRGTPEGIERFGETWATATDAQKMSRTLAGWKGRGAYSWGRNIRKAGQWLRPVTSALRNRAVGYIDGSGMYTGHGAYEEDGTVNNLIVGTGNRTNSVPTITNSEDETGTICISHKEYLTDIFGPTTAFNVQSYALNPALQTSFDWLSQIACNYDEYSFDQLLFEYRSTTTDIGSSTTGQCGTIVMSTNYNAAAAPFTSKAQMENYAHSMSCKTTEHMMHGVECDKSKVAIANTLFTRANPVVTNQDLKTYDHGLFQLAVCNSPAGFQNNPIGELWVHYTVRLRKPKLFASLGFDIDKDEWLTGYVSGNTTTGANLFGGTSGNVYANQQNNIGCAVSKTATSVTITFPASLTGSFKITLYQQLVATSSAALNAPNYASTGNVALINDLFQNQSMNSTSVPSGGGTGTNIVSVFDVFLTTATGGTNNSVTLTSTSSTMTTATRAQLIVQQYQSNGLTASGQYNTYVSGASTLASNFV